MACTCNGHTTAGGCHSHTTGGCNGHNTAGGCHSHVGTGCSSNSTTGSCASHSSTGSCASHATSGSCTSHVNSCPAHGGYVSGTTITFTNVNVSAGEEIDAQNEINELLSKMNAESNRRSVLGESTPISLTLTNPLASSQIRQIRDLYLDILNTTAASPITNTQINVGQPLLATTIETMKDGIVADSAPCQCDCNYACTCNCNYACTCDCNYACTCNCNYACTCNCNYSCTCVCNYSDERLKTNIIYF